MQSQRHFTSCLVLVIFPLSAQPAAPAISSEARLPEPELQAGKWVYLQHCAASHGVKGDGTGPASVWLFPRPGNCSAGRFKVKSIPGTALPTDEDLFNAVARGMPGSSMPSFTYLTEKERRDAVRYVKFLTAYTGSSGPLLTVHTVGLPSMGFRTVRGAGPGRHTTAPDRLAS
jgi:mono/diheme cytochrome c family protein